MRPNNSGLYGMKIKSNLGLIWLDKSDLHGIKKQFMANETQ